MAISKSLSSPVANLGKPLSPRTPARAPSDLLQLSPGAPVHGASDLLRGQHWRELCQGNLEVFLSAETPEDEEHVFYRKEKLVGSTRGILFSGNLR